MKMAGKASTKIVKKTTLVKKKRTEDSEINFKLSWMTKLKHEDFLYKASTLFRLTELFMRHKIKPTTDINVDWMFDNVKANIDKMQSMPPKQMGHDLTKTIRELHAKRKGMLTGIRGYLKTIIKFPNANVPNHQMAAHTIAFWLQNIYGTRHYDFGITELSGRMRGMFLTFDRDEELQQAFETCGQTYAMSELRRVNEELSTAYTRRDLETAYQDMEPSFWKVRDEIYKGLRSILDLLEFYIKIDAKNQEAYIGFKEMLYHHYFKPMRAGYWQQVTKRQKRRERVRKAEQEREAESQNQ